MSYALDHPIVERAPESARAAFIRRTYGHLAGAVLAFIALETVLLNLPNIHQIVWGMFSTPMTWLVIIFAWLGVSWLAQVWAQSDTSRTLQYVGLSLYVAAISVIFLPLLYVAAYLVKDPNLIPQAGILTLCVFAGLTISAFITRRDFSFLGPIVSIGCLLVSGVIIVGLLFGGFGFGLLIAFVMVALMSAAILYQTSNIIHRYRTDQHVAAALALFAAVAMLFYYILYILLEVSGRGNN
jgi:FtsH-binding integral membrane protein